MARSNFCHTEVNTLTVTTNQSLVAAISKTLAAVRAVLGLNQGVQDSKGKAVCDCLTL